jgi:hypothetical protein
MRFQTSNISVLSLKFSELPHNVLVVVCNTARHYLSLNWSSTGSAGIDAKSHEFLQLQRGRDARICQLLSLEYDIWALMSVCARIVLVLVHVGTMILPPSIVFCKKNRPQSAGGVDKASATINIHVVREIGSACVATAQHCC